MYNLNVNVNPSPTGAAGFLGVTTAASEVTPRTPEIVNSLIAMTNPFEGYGSGNEKGTRDRTDSTSSGEPSPPSVQHTCSQLIKEGKPETASSVSVISRIINHKQNALVHSNVQEILHGRPLPSTVQIRRRRISESRAFDQNGISRCEKRDFRHFRLLR